MVTRIVEVQCLLEGLSEEVRPDFLSGTNRAVVSLLFYLKIYLFYNVLEGFYVDVLHK